MNLQEIIMLTPISTTTETSTTTSGAAAAADSASISKTTPTKLTPTGGHKRKFLNLREMSQSTSPASVKKSSVKPKRFKKLNGVWLMWSLLLISLLRVTNSQGKWLCKFVEKKNATKLQIKKCLNKLNYLNCIKLIFYNEIIVLLLNQVVKL